MCDNAPLRVKLVRVFTGKNFMTTFLHHLPQPTNHALHSIIIGNTSSTCSLFFILFHTIGRIEGSAWLQQNHQRT